MGGNTLLYSVPIFFPSKSNSCVRDVSFSLSAVAGLTCAPSAQFEIVPPSGGASTGTSGFELARLGDDSMRQLVGDGTQSSCRILAGTAVSVTHNHAIVLDVIVAISVIIFEVKCLQYEM